MRSQRFWLSVLLSLVSCSFLSTALAQLPTVLDSPSTQVSAGLFYTCALTTAGGVQCWGNNDYGQLGDGTNTASTVPVAVSGLSNGVAIAAGGTHACALTTLGGVRCWGENGDGELGNGATTSSSLPVAVTGLGSGVAAIAAGFGYTCALTTAGAVQCWGYNNKGQLGNNSTTTSTVPVAVSGLSSGAVAIAVGGYHACALTTSGDVKCWGSNDKGQLGNNSQVDSLVPVTVSGLSGSVASITAGFDHTCALTTAGGVRCWGYNGTGQLGNNSTTNSPVPVAVNGLSGGVAAISAGAGHTCALTTSGGMQCWGSSSNGQLGNNSTTDSKTPVAVSGLSTGVAGISAGHYHTCALTTAGGVQCWGSNSDGQIGNDTTTDSNTPVAVAYLASGVDAIATGTSHTCALTSAGGVQCWGSNNVGQLGNNSTTDSNTPVAVTGLASGVVEIAAGASHTCALTLPGDVWCWGNNGLGQLGDNSTTNSLVPVAVSGLSGNAVAIAAGDFHTCALTTTGEARCWGYNNKGQLGNNSTTNSLVPATVTGLASGVDAISAGASHTCALIAGGVKCWGYNGTGQLGNNSTTDSKTPVAVTNLTSGVAAIAAGANHSCALAAGGVKCWGSNSNGQLGNNSTTDSKAPVAVNGLASGVAAIAAGGKHTCALTTSAGARCWGSNSDGQLGNNSTTDSKTPVAVTGLANGMVAIAAGTSHTCALTAAGGMRCWGDNAFGQIGDDSSTDRISPIAVRAGQTIAFEPPATVSPSIASLTLSAIASSARAVSFDTWTTTTCLVSGNTLIFFAQPQSALCGVRASQAGGTVGSGGSDAPARQELRLIRISDAIFQNGFEG